MENSGEILTGDPSDRTPQWYLANGSNPLGPFRASEIIERLQSGSLPWITYTWRAGMPQWERLCDVAEFQNLTPGRPTTPKPTASVSKAKQAVASLQKKQESRITAPETPITRWFLFYNDAQYGPFSGDEVQRFLRIGKIHGRVHAWCEGMATWVRLEKIEGFAEAVAAAVEIRAAKRGEGAAPVPPPKQKQPSDQRETPRKPLIARILHATEKEVGSGMCRDVSIGGMQVLTDSLPGDVGTSLRLNIRPMEGSLPAFVAEGVIVRILEDQRGFCFRFTKLSNEGKKTLEAHIQEGGI